jgi:hypothetical protein
MTQATATKWEKAANMATVAQAFLVRVSLGLMKAAYHPDFRKHIDELISKK